MSGRRVLVTGGAGFVGSHLVDALVERGDRVVVLDNLDPQVHGPEQAPPEWLNERAELVRGDVRHREIWPRVLDGVDVIYHLAAAVGVGQSMYEVAKYTAVNTLGTANLLQALIDRDQHPDRLVVASSMSIYGEGRYRRPDGRAPQTRRRDPEDLRAALAGSRRITASPSARSRGRTTPTAGSSTRSTAPPTSCTACPTSPSRSRWSSAARSSRAWSTIP